MDTEILNAVMEVEKLHCDGGQAPPPPPQPPQPLQLSQSSQPPQQPDIQIQERK